MADDLAQYVGEAVRRWRTHRGWTGGELARRSRVSATYISKVEKGQTLPPLRRLYTFASVLGCHAGQLLPREVGAADLRDHVPFGGALDPPADG